MINALDQFSVIKDLRIEKSFVEGRRRCIILLMSSAITPLITAGALLTSLAAVHMLSLGTGAAVLLFAPTLSFPFLSIEVHASKNFHEGVSWISQLKRDKLFLNKYNRSLAEAHAVEGIAMRNRRA